MILFRKNSLQTKLILVFLLIVMMTSFSVSFFSYFGLADMKGIANRLDEWTRRRIRMCYWKQWKKIKTRHDKLVRLGIDNFKAWEFANTRKGYWRISNSPILAITFTNKLLNKMGYFSFTERYAQVINS